MGYSLWRNGQLLGKVHVVFPTVEPDLVGGMLHPVPEYGDIEPLIQLRMDHLTGRPVLQQSIVGYGVPERPTNGRRESALRRLGVEVAGGVESACVLELRDGNDQPLELGMLSLQRVDDRENRGEVRTACEQLGVGFSPWYLFGRSPAMASASANRIGCGGATG